MLFVRLLVNAIAVLVSAYIIPGVRVDTFVTALVAAVILGLLNAVAKPILVLLTLPITVLSLGLFILVINTILVLLASAVVPGFEVDSFLSALLFSLVLSVVSAFLFSLA